MNNEEMIIEINGVKMEVDTRHAKTIDTYKIGMPVRCLIKKYSDDWESAHGIIIGFENFKDLPTIKIAFIEEGYSTCDLKFKSFNAKTQDMQIIPDVDYQHLCLNKERIEELMEKKIDSKQRELDSEKEKLEYFRKYFGHLLEASDSSHY